MGRNHHVNTKLSRDIPKSNSLSSLLQPRALSLGQGNFIFLKYRPPSDSICPSSISIPPRNGPYPSVPPSFPFQTDCPLSCGEGLFLSLCAAARIFALSSAALFFSLSFLPQRGKWGWNEVRGEMQVLRYLLGSVAGLAALVTLARSLNRYGMHSQDGISLLTQYSLDQSSKEWTPFWQVYIPPSSLCAFWFLKCWVLPTLEPHKQCFLLLFALMPF